MSSDEKISVTEFRSWLEGVLDFQPEGWTPNIEQWTKILEKIKQLDDTPKISVPPSNPSVGTPSTAPQRNMGPTEGAGPAAAPRNPRPQGPAINLDQKVSLPPEQPKPKRQLTVQKQGTPQIIDDGSGGKIVDTGKVYKTGEIDTSHGEYKSDFV